MGMALRKDVVKACQKAGTDKPVDLAFLSAQTMGDRSLEQEILSLFLAQAPVMLERMKSSDGSEEVYQTAHTIKGLAKSIGAFKLADLAKCAEDAGVFETSQIEHEFGRICSYIQELAPQH